MFSRITSKFQGKTNPLYSLRNDLERQRCTIQDLVSGNITEKGFVFPTERLTDILGRASRKCVIYSPDSLGNTSARKAVSRYYRERWIRVDADHILITPGTSLSYWYCFKLLANEGDEILCPQPSYPLLDYIAALCGVKLVHYNLLEDKGWAMDVDQLEASISTRTRAIVLISPHNPTGRIATSDEILRLAEVAERHDLAILSDEVFCEFLIEMEAMPHPAMVGAPLVLTMNGFSKMFALPGLKFGWMAVSGKKDRVQQAMRSLELISDTFLPVNEIVQAAAADIFREGKKVSRDFSAPIRNCWETAEYHLKDLDCFSYVKPQGGFYITLQLHDVNEEKAAIHLLKRNHILVHPGYFYDMSGNHLVLSFIQDSETMQSALEALKETLSDIKKTV